MLTSTFTCMNHASGHNFIHTGYTICNARQDIYIGVHEEWFNMHVSAHLYRWLVTPLIQLLNKHVKDAAFRV